MNERKLTKAELDKSEEIVMGMKSNKKELIKRYGKKAEEVMYATARKRAKEKTESMEKPNRLSELVKQALMNPKKADLNKDGKLSDYEKKRGAAIEKSMNEAPQPPPFNTVSKKRAKADMKQFLKGKRADGMGKYDAIILGIDKEGNQTQLKSLKDIDNPKYVEYALADEDYKIPTIKEDLDLGHEDDEPHMLKANLYRIGKYAMELYQMMDKFEGQGEVDLPHWWQSKIIKSESMITSAKHYLDFELKEPEIDAMVDVASEEEIIGEDQLNEIESGDIVSYEGEDHTVMRIADDFLGKRIYIRPNEEAVFGGKKDTFWVKPEDLNEKLTNNKPSQDEVDKFFSDTQNEMHYLASKPVMGQKGDRVRSEIEPWDEYDLSNWNALVKKAKIAGKIAEMIKGAHSVMGDKSKKKKRPSKKDIKLAKDTQSDYEKSKEEEEDYEGLAARSGASLEEDMNGGFKVGDKVTYLGHPAVVTATKEYNGRDFVSVSYDKGNGATKAPMILVKSGDVKAVKEDMNDPVLVKARAAKMADEKEKAKQSALDKKYGSSFMDKLDAEINLKNELSDLKDERKQLMIDMEQEAEPEGGEIADDYGSRLNGIEAEIDTITAELDDLRMYESLNEDKYYITRNLGKGQGMALVKDVENGKVIDRPKEFKSYNDAQKEADRLEKGDRNMTSYFVSDKDMKLSSKLNESNEEVLSILKTKDDKFVIGMAAGKYPRSIETKAFDTQQDACRFFGANEKVILRNLTENKIDESTANEYEVLGDVYSTCTLDETKKPKTSTIAEKLSKQLKSTVSEVKIDYDFSEEELKRVIKQLKSGASTEVGMIKAFEKALGRELTDDEIRGFKLNEAKAPKTKEELEAAIEDAERKIENHAKSLAKIDSAPGGGNWSSSSAEGKKERKLKDAQGKLRDKIDTYTKKLKKLK